MIPSELIAQLARRHQRQFVEAWPSSVTAALSWIESDLWVLLHDFSSDDHGLGQLLAALQSSQNKAHSNFRLWLSVARGAEFYRLRFDVLRSSVVIDIDPPVGVSASAVWYQRRSRQWSAEYGVQCRSLLPASYALSVAEAANNEWEERQAPTARFFHDGVSDLMHVLARLESTSQEWSSKYTYQPIISKIAVEILFYNMSTDARCGARFCRGFSECLSRYEDCWEPEGVIGEMCSRCIVETLCPIEAQLPMRWQRRVAGARSEAQPSLAWLLSANIKQLRAQLSLWYGKLPDRFDSNAVAQELALTPIPIQVQIFLSAETDRLNRVLACMRRSLLACLAAMLGTAPLPPEEYISFQALSEALTPPSWHASCTGTVDQCIHFVTKRCTHLRSWMQPTAPPAVVWLGGFEDPAAFVQMLICLVAAESGVCLAELQIAAHVSSSSAPKLTQWSAVWSEGFDICDIAIHGAD